MKNKYTQESLREAIRVLEIRQAEEKEILREQLINVYENLKPINIIKGIFRDIANTRNLENDLFSNIASLISGFISKKLLVGKSNNPMLKILGTGIQLGMTAFISRNYEQIKDSILQFFTRGQEKNVVEE